MKVLMHPKVSLTPHIGAAQKRHKIALVQNSPIHAILGDLMKKLNYVGGFVQFHLLIIFVVFGITGVYRHCLPNH